MTDRILVTSAHCVPGASGSRAPYPGTTLRLVCALRLTELSVSCIGASLRPHNRIVIRGRARPYYTFDFLWASQGSRPGAIARSSPPVELLTLPRLCGSAQSLRCIFNRPSLALSECTGARTADAASCRDDARLTAAANRLGRVSPVVDSSACRRESRLQRGCLASSTNRCVVRSASMPEFAPLLRGASTDRQRRQGPPPS